MFEAEKKAEEETEKKHEEEQDTRQLELRLRLICQLRLSSH